MPITAVNTTPASLDELKSFRDLQKEAMEATIRLGDASIKSLEKQAKSYRTNQKEIERDMLIHLVQADGFLRESSSS